MDKMWANLIFDRGRRLLDIYRQLLLTSLSGSSRITGSLEEANFNRKIDSKFTGKHYYLFDDHFSYCNNLS